MGYLDQAWDGVRNWINEFPLIWTSPQMKYKYPYVSLKVINNMINLVARGYITKVVILVMISLLFVPKVTDYIHVFFYATVSGLNNYLWDPKFMLP